MREQPNYYSILPANVRYDKRLKANEKLLYSEITALANVNGYCFASNSYFAELYGVIKTTVSKWISHLEELGYIRIELLYKNNSKEISERKIHIAQPSFDVGGIANLNNTLSTKKTRGYCQKEQGGIVKKDKDNITSTNTTSINSHHHGVDEDDVDTIIEKWNELGGKIPKIKAINPGTKRFKELKARIDEYGLDELIKGMEKIKESKFLQGLSNKSDFLINFDWFVNGDNFAKVLEDNYKDKVSVKSYRSKMGPSEKSYSEKAREKRFKRILESDMAYG